MGTIPAVEKEIKTDVGALEARIVALEAKVKTEENKIVAFVKAHWPHFVTWVGGIGAWVLSHGLKL